MRLLTYEREGAPRLGLLLQERVVDLADATIGALPESMQAFIEAGAPALGRARELIDSLSAGADALARASTPLADVRLLAPIPRPPGKTPRAQPGSSALRPNASPRPRR